MSWSLDSSSRDVSVYEKGSSIILQIYAKLLENQSNCLFFHTSLKMCLKNWLKSQLLLNFARKYFLMNGSFV